MEEHIYVTDTEFVYPVLLIPKKCTTLDTNCEANDNVFIDVNITSPDTEGNDMCIYTGLCNIKLIDSNDANPNEVASQSDDDNRDPSPEGALGYPFNQSQIWIDPDRSPYVCNSYNTVESQEHYSVSHESHSSRFTLAQHSTYIRKNFINYREQIQISSADDFGHKKFRKTQNEPSQELNSYRDNEYECGVILSQMPEEIMNENDEKARDLTLNGVRVNNALKQLMSSDIQSLSKPQKTILYMGHDSHCGRTIQKIAVNNPSLECVDLSNEAIDNTQTNHKIYQCNKCTQIFDQISSFKQHIRLSHKNSKSFTDPELRFICTECGKCLKSQEKFEMHCLGHGDPELECNKCHKVYSTKFTLRIHKRVHQRKFRCSCCTKSYTNFKELENHMSKIHFILLCNICNFTATKENELAIHKLSHRDEQDFPHQSIDHMPSDSDTLTPPHDYAFNSDLEDASKMEEIKNADMVIAKVMSNTMFLRQSKHSKHNKRYKKACDVCQKTFDRVNDLKRHLIEHVIRSTLAKNPVNKNGTLTIQCEVCQTETFTKIDRYKAHLREHAKLTLYKCAFCDKSFSDSSNFSKHKKIHGASFFQCDLCNRKFNTKKTITQHMEIHNKNTPIPCPYCDQKFHFKSMLNKHVKNAHTRKLPRFRCKFCLEYFKTLKDKWDHEWWVHSARKMIVDCLICGSKFRKYSELKWHCFKKHDVDIPPAKKLLRKRRNF